MIAFLRGQLAEALPTQVVLDVNGVGYEVLIPLSSFDQLPAPGGEVTLLTHLAIRDDAHVLYGFSTGTERDLFRQLIRHVSGIGPKIALNVLSGTTPASFRAAVANGDVKAICDAIYKSTKPVNNTSLPPRYRRNMIKVLVKRACEE